MTAGNSGARPASKTWFPYWKPKPEAQLRLFCFPFAGGTASNFQRWADFGPSIEAIAVQYPGREMRLPEPPFRSVRALVNALGPEMLPLLDRPFVLFGYSLGALIAFEMANWLRSEGAPAPQGLMVAAASPPGRRKSRNMYLLPDKAFIQELRDYGGSPTQVLAHQELMEMLLPMLRADFEMVETYALGEVRPLSIPIAVWGGTEDRGPAPQQLEGWRDFTSQGFTSQLISGGHFFMLSAGAELREAMEKTLMDWSAERM